MGREDLPELSCYCAIKLPPDRVRTRVVPSGSFGDWKWEEDTEEHAYCDTSGQLMGI